jgi:hypothetical protein
LHGTSIYFSSHPPQILIANVNKVGELEKLNMDNASHVPAESAGRGDDYSCLEGETLQTGVEDSDQDQDERRSAPPIRSASGPAVLQRLLDEASRLTRSPLNDLAAQQRVREILRRAHEARLSPGDARTLHVVLATLTRWPMIIINQRAIDARNDVPGVGIIGSVAEAAAAFQALLEQRYRHFIWNGGSGYGYTEEAGYYVRLPPAELDRMLTEWMGHTTFAEKAQQRKELIGRLEGSTNSSSFFDNLPPGVNLAKSFVKWDDKDGFVEQHPSLEHRSRERLMFECLPGAMCPTFLRGLSRILPCQAAQEALQEAIGAAVFGLIPASDKARRIILLVGRRNSGKSTILELLQEFFPKYAVASVPPEEWGKEYSRALLEAARLNIVTELGGRQELAGDHVKRIASCELILGRLPYGQPRKFRPIAWHFFATNELPRVSDSTSAFERRMLVISFDQSLRQDEIKGDFLDRVREELPGILNWASDGAERLIRRGYFLPPPGHQEAVLNMQFGNNLVEVFARLCVDAAPGDPRGVTSEALWTSLRAFAEVRDVHTDGWTDATHMRSLSGILKKLYGAERATRNGRPFYRFVRLREASR